MEDIGAHLKNQAFLTLSAFAGQESSTSSRLKHFTDTLVCLGRAFEVLVGTDLLADFLTLD